MTEIQKILRPLLDKEITRMELTKTRGEFVNNRELAEYRKMRSQTVRNKAIERREKSD